MISYLNVKQLEALAEIPKSLVVDCDGKPDATIYFTKVNQSAVSYYDIVRHLNELTAPTVGTRADLAYIIGEICTQPRNKNLQVSRWLIISHEYHIGSYILSAIPPFDSRQETVRLSLDRNPHRVFLIERDDSKNRYEKFIYNFYQVSDTPTSPVNYGVEDNVLFIKSYEDCFSELFYTELVKSSSLEDLNKLRKTLINRLNIVKSRLIDLIQNDKTE
jgi:hypothetical protein